MFGGAPFPDLLLLAAGIGGFAAGALLVRLAGRAARRSLDRGTEELHHRVRALEADLRVAQRTAEQSKADQEKTGAEYASLTAELEQLREAARQHEDRVRKLKADIQHECGKTARLRQELADRAEEMVRTHVQLRDVQNELGVTQVGSDVVMDQITALERERDDLNTMVGNLRRELESRTRGAPGGGPDAELLLDC